MHDSSSAPLPPHEPDAYSAPTWPPRRDAGAGRSRLLTLLLFLLLGYFIFQRWSDRRGTPSLEPRVVTARGDLAADERATIELFRQSSPSVVFITTLAQRSDFRSRSIAEIPQGSGSGFIWDDAGHIVTNFHVVQHADGGRVTLNDHTTYRAELVGAAPAYDLALLRISAPKERLRPIPIGASSDLLVGQKVFAIGNPFGLDQSLTTGVVSALGRSIESVTGRPIEDVIQTDAPINPGNSGGPLLDSAGRIIGVNTAIFSPSGASAGIGFAVPIDTVNRVIPQLIAQGRVVRPTLGVESNDAISQQLAARTGVMGMLVLGVQPGSPAAEAGLRPTMRGEDRIVLGDVIVEIAGRPVRTLDQMFAILERHHAGDEIEIKVLRDGETATIKAKLGPPAE